MLKMTEIMYSLGKYDALNLRNRAKDMDGTQVINEEIKIPVFRTIDYINYPIGSPVKSLGQVYKLKQPYNASVHTQLPKDARDRWSLCHTKNPKKAKPWVDALGDSGMYMTGECYLTKDGRVKRCLTDNVVHDADALPDAWEDVI